MRTTLNILQIAIGIILKSIVVIVIIKLIILTNSKFNLEILFTFSLSIAYLNLIVLINAFFAL